MLDLLPSDQRALLVSRLGDRRLQELEAEVLEEFPDGEKKSELPETRGDRLRGKPRMAVPLTAFYMRAVAEIGSDGAAGGAPPKLPTPTMAWLKVMEAKLDQGFRFDHEPTFHHPAISKTIASFGGWNAFLRELSDTRQHTMRNRFFRNYREITEQGGWHE